jgi:hypothetical protein
VIYRLPVGRLRCTVISDGQMEPPWEPPLEAFFTPDSGVPDQDVLVHAYHMPFPGLGMIKRHGDIYEWCPAFK